MDFTSPIWDGYKITKVEAPLIWFEYQCGACGTAFTWEEWDERHSGHYPERSEMGGCVCDVVFHSSCCPKCNPEGIPNSVGTSGSQQVTP